jgi:hypothetical protein
MVKMKEKQVLEENIIEKKTIPKCGIVILDFPFLD